MSASEWVLDAWDEYWEMIAAALLIAVAVGLVVWIVVVGYREEQREIAACQASGGSWVVVGHHFSTTYVKSGSIMVPIESRVDEYDCRRAPRPGGPDA